MRISAAAMVVVCVTVAGASAATGSAWSGTNLAVDGVQAALGAVPGPAQEQPTADPDPIYAPNQVLVRFGPEATTAIRQALHARLGGQVIAEIPQLGVQVVRLYDDAVVMASAYQASDAVEYAEPDYFASIQGAPDAGAEAAGRTGSALPGRPDRLADTTPNDSLYSQQWHHERIVSPRAWDYSQGDDIVVAVVDTGANCGHADLTGKCVAGYDFVNGDTDPSDDHGHGTHVSGIVSAATHNGTGVAAVGWNAKVMPVKALDRTGNGVHSAISSGITWAVDHGADVINLSLGGPWTTSTLRNAVNYAVDHGVPVVAAAGNEGTSNPSYPAAYSNAIAVAATSQSDTRPSFSNYGSHIDVSAPGVAILSTVRQGGYQAWSGTSMASPVVAGIAGLLLEQAPSRTPAQIEQILEQTADDIGSPGWDEFTGYGRVNAGAALALDPNGGPLPTPTPTNTRPAPTAAATRPPVTPSGDFAQQVEDLINLERADAGYSPLHTSAALRQASGRHSADMGANQFCGHGGSDGSTADSRMRDAGYPLPYGEIVACGQVSPYAVVQAWMGSPGHRSMILCASCTEMGAGYAGSDSGYLYYWTVTFGMADTSGTPTPTLVSASPEPSHTPGPPTETPTPVPPTPTNVPGSTEVALTPPANRVGWVVSTEPYLNHFDGPDIYAGYWDNKVYRGAAQFDLEPIPSGAWIYHARLELSGRSDQFLGSSGSWTVNLLDDDVDANFALHGYSAINGAQVESTLLPVLGVVQLQVGQTNVFNFGAPHLAALSSRIAGSRLVSFRMDGPSTGSSLNLFAWDTGHTESSRYPGPRLIVNYSLEAPTAEPSLTPTEEAQVTDTPEPPTEGPTATETNTPEPPTPTDTPPPPPPTSTPTPTAVPTLGSPVQIVPNAYSVGWVRENEPGNHFGDDSIFSGYYQGLTYVGAFQFDLTTVPVDAEVRSAQLTLAGLSDRYLSNAGNGLWRVKMLQANADAGWPNHSFPQVASARVFAQLPPELRQYDLGVGRSNTFDLGDVLRREIEWRAATTRKVSFRIDGPRLGLSNIFAWDSGYGSGTRVAPVLSLVYGPPGSGEPRPTTVPEYEEKVEEIIGLINEVRAEAGVAPVAKQDQLRRAADVHLFDMTFHDFFSHTGSDGTTPGDRVARTGYHAAAVAELLAARSSSAQTVLDAWMGRSQRDDVLNPAFTEVGAAYAVALNAAYTYYWTVVLAQPGPTPTPTP